MAIFKAKDRQQQLFTQLAMMLFFIEWIRGAVLVAYLPASVLTDERLSASLVGIAVSVHYLTDSVIKGLAGYLLDRIPKRLVLHGGFALGTIGLLLMVSTHSAWILIAASACLGAGFSPIWIICMSLIKEENRAQQMGTLYVYWMAGLGLGPITMNLVMDGSLTLSLCLIAACLVAGWGIAVFVNLDNLAVSRMKLSVEEQVIALWNKVKAGGFLVPGMLLQTMAGGILAPFLTSFAVRQMGLSHSELSLVLLMGGAGVVLLLIPMGRWFDRVGGRWFLVLGFGIFSAALFVLTTVNSLASALLLALLLGCAYAALLPAWNALMARHIPEDAVGIGWGLLFSFEGLGVVIGPLLGGWLASFGGERLPFWVSACLFGFISIVYLLSPARLFRLGEGRPDTLLSERGTQRMPDV